MAEQTFLNLVTDNRIWFGPDGSNRPRLKKFLSESKGTRPWTWWDNRSVGHNQEASQELKSLFADQVVFDNPKPVRLLQRIIQLATDKTDSEIVLDFFAGSGSTAHALLLQNAKDSGQRKFILIQISQEIKLGSNDYKAESTAFKLGYRSIAEIGKERIRRAGKLTQNERVTTRDEKNLRLPLKNSDPSLDIGFRVLKVDSSNMEDVYYNPDATDQDLLSQMTDNIKPDRTPQDLLFQVLLDWGVDLSLPIRTETVKGKLVFFVDENALVACFDRGVNEELVNELARYKPLRVVFRDNGFVSDAVKINVDQIFKQMSPGTEVKSI